MKILKSVFLVACMFSVHIALSATQLGYVWTSAPRYATVGETITVSAKYYSEFGVSDPYFFCAGNANGDFVYSMPSIQQISESNGTFKFKITSKGNGVLYVFARASSAPASDWIQITVGSTPSSAALSLSSPVSEVRPGTKVTLTYTATGGSGSPTWSISSPMADTVANGVVQISAVNTARTVTITARYSGLTKSVSLSVKAICDAPVITPGDGTVFTTQRQKVVLSCTTSGSTIYYTLDGSTPTSSSSIYSGAFNIASDTTIKAFASASGFYDSSITTARLTKYKETLSAPEISVKNVETDAMLERHHEVSLFSENGATIYYTLNGSNPSRNSTLYREPFRVFSSTTVKALAILDGWNDSNVSSLVVNNPMSLSDAVNCVNRALESSSWIIDASQASAGMVSAASGTCVDGTTNTIYCKTTGFKSVSFRWKCSCEDDPDHDDWDYLCFLVNGVEKARIDGNTDWQEVSVDLLTADTCLLTWEYRKDSSLSSGKDCGWLDGLSITEMCTTNSGTSIPFKWLYRYYGDELGSRSDYERKSNSRGENGLLVWQSYVTGVDPTNENAKLAALISINTQGKPVVSWSPDLNENGTKNERVYRVLGAKTLGNDWDDVTELSDPDANGYRFFKVTVEMP